MSFISNSWKPLTITSLFTDINRYIYQWNNCPNGRYQEDQDGDLPGPVESLWHPRGGRHRGLRGHRQVQAEGRDDQPVPDPGGGQDGAVQQHRGQGHQWCQVRGNCWGTGRMLWWCCDIVFWDVLMVWRETIHETRSGRSLVLVTKCTHVQARSRVTYITWPMAITHSMCALQTVLHDHFSTLCKDDLHWTLYLYGKEGCIVNSTGCPKKSAPVAHCISSSFSNLHIFKR